MSVTVLLFGRYSALWAGGSSVLELPPGATVADVAAALETADARFAGVAQHCRFAVNEDYSALETPLHEGDTVAVLPPMSGG